MLHSEIDTSRLAGRRNYAFTQRFDSGTFTVKPRLDFGESFALRVVGNIRSTVEG